MKYPGTLPDKPLITPLAVVDLWLTVFPVTFSADIPGCLFGISNSGLCLSLLQKTGHLLSVLFFCRAPGECECRFDRKILPDMVIFMQGKSERKDRNADLYFTSRRNRLEF